MDGYCYFGSFQEHHLGLQALDRFDPFLCKERDSEGQAWSPERRVSIVELDPIVITTIVITTMLLVELTNFPVFFFV